MDAPLSQIKSQEYSLFSQLYKTSGPKKKKQKLESRNSSKTNALNAVWQSKDWFAIDRLLWASAVQLQA